MSDSKNDPKFPPPDDFSKTTPNISFDEDDSAWANAGPKAPAETPADDWGKTVINYDVRAEHEEQGGFKDIETPSKNAPSQPEWGMTQQNINLNNDFESEEQAPQDDGFGVTIPYFKLPDTDRDRNKVIPPTPSQVAAEKEKESKGGIPLWFWATSAIMVFLAFSFVVFLGIWYFFLADKGFQVTIIGAKPGSRFKVDGSEWGIAAEDNKFKLSGLQAGTRMVEIINPASECTPNPVEVVGKEGERVEKIVSCKDIATNQPDCVNTRSISERERCAEIALDGLSNPPDLDELLKALNILIINFESGKATIPSARMRILRKAAGKIQQLPASVVIEIGGHTDNVGNDDSNMRLSDARAAAVKKVLVDFGVRDSALVERGYGETKPKATNNTDQGRFDNRRIEYKAVQR
ncbi:MAG: OmpA family protein [Pyrinomonadaceae bacterium]